MAAQELKGTVMEPRKPGRPRHTPGQAEAARVKRAADARERRAPNLVPRFRDERLYKAQQYARLAPDALNLATWLAARSGATVAGIVNTLLRAAPSQRATQ